MAVYYDGTYHEGSRGFAGEIGHIPVRRTGFPASGAPAADGMLEPVSLCADSMFARNSWRFQRCLLKKHWRSATFSVRI